MKALIALILVAGLSGCMQVAPASDASPALEPFTLDAGIGGNPVFVSNATTVHVYEDDDAPGIGEGCRQSATEQDEPGAWFQVKIYNSTGVAYFYAQHRMPEEVGDDNLFHVNLSLPPEGPWIVVAIDVCGRGLLMDFDSGEAVKLEQRDRVDRRIWENVSVATGQSFGTAEHRLKPEWIFVQIPATPSRTVWPAGSNGRASWHIDVDGTDIEKYWVTLNEWSISWGLSMVPNGMEARLEVARPSLGETWQFETHYIAFDLNKTDPKYFQNDWTDCRTGLNCEMHLSPLYRPDGA